MYKNILKTVLLVSFGVLCVGSARADIRADLGGLRIRIATDAPPRPQHEYRTQRPDHDSVWLDGYWDRQGDRWTWIGGRWERPADRHARWIKPRYQREGGAWRYEPAHWSHQQLEEGDDYRQWREERRSDHDHDHGHGYDREHH